MTTINQSLVCRKPSGCDGRLRYNGEDWSCYKCGWVDHTRSPITSDVDPDISVMNIRYKGPHKRLIGRIMKVRPTVANVTSQQVMAFCPYECGEEMEPRKKSGQDGPGYFYLKCPVRHRVVLEEDFSGWR